MSGQDGMSCQLCRFSDAGGLNHAFVRCRRHAPARWSDMDLVYRWPVVASADWCGEFEWITIPIKEIK